jgi:hypothetical protein
VSPRSASGLSSVEEAPRDWEDSDEVARRKARRLNDLSLARRAFPYKAEAQRGPTAPARLHELVRNAVEDSGFHLAVDYGYGTGAFAGWRPAWLEGLVVGERNVSLNPVLSRWALVQGILGCILGAAVFTFGLVVSPTLGPWFLVPFFVGLALVFWGAVLRLPAVGTFDSDVVYVHYKARIDGDPSSNEADGALPRTFEISSGAGRATSANWQAKGGGGRSVKRVQPGQWTMSSIPRDVLRRVLDAPLA